jgi:hypothetical protein
MRTDLAQAICAAWMPVMARPGTWAAFNYPFQYLLLDGHVSLL